MAVHCPNEFTKEIVKAVSVKYLLYLPERYTESVRQWPLIVHLHGAGECGDDLELVKGQGIPYLIEAGNQLPFIVLSPQCPEYEQWDPATIKALIEDISNTHKVDTKRIYLTGFSMGGYGGWATAIRYPKLFAAIAPICSFANPKHASRLTSLPIWAFHGAKDDCVPAEGAQRMIDAVNSCGGKAKFTLYPEAGHDSWSKTYSNGELFGWFLEHEKC
ncbi:phospholipase [Corallincola luteus]|uniref:Phospholipase n=1 Tax=Corallincola luteus TaxID=1775177 RepID=A0ABY2AQ15_9GAMM|nr:PHB depolymerase family esterase [Corallincola luteus]TCI05284.1 phospholipase [Corallincola luteus]